LQHARMAGCWLAAPLLDVCCNVRIFPLLKYGSCYGQRKELQRLLSMPVFMMSEC
jgi:hypothetical protein